MAHWHGHLMENGSITFKFKWSFCHHLDMCKQYRRILIGHLIQYSHLFCTLLGQDGKVLILYCENNPS